MQKEKNLISEEDLYKMIQSLTKDLTSDESVFDLKPIFVFNYSLL